MVLKIKKSFQKNFESCPKEIKEAAMQVIDEITKAKTLKEVKNVKKLVGFTGYYKIRTGQYRIGLKEEKPDIILMCLLERSQIYKKFP